MTSVLQPWVMDLPFMQQSVLLTSIRGPDNTPKYSSTKYLLRWMRRCILLSSFEGRIIDNPWHNDGGSFLGASLEVHDAGTLGGKAGRPIYRPIDWQEDGAYFYEWEKALNCWVDKYLKELDALPHHFQMHFMHSAEIVGYKHPGVKSRHWNAELNDEVVDHDTSIADWWREVYYRLVDDMHLHPEEPEEMDARLGDSREGWLKRADPATTA